ncbi:MAG: hypothetical protein E7445_02085 [Ruminococcaceae bacterium]|nr:hypothetical protein [Oscillospiraceae bacterium]
MPGPENKWKEQSSQPIWDSKTIGDKYGILGETHRDFEQSWLAETQKIDKSKGNSSAAPFNANTFAFRSTKYAYDYDRSKYRKLSGLYGVLSSIQSANTVVTADMISPATYQTCKKSYGISKKELKRLVSDAQQGRVPDFAVKSHHQDATDMQQVSNAVSFEVMKDASTGNPVTGNIHVLRQLEAEAILTDATLTEEESLDFQKEYGFSKKDLEKLSLEVQSSKTSVFLKA